jgi:hypothetical protein
MSESLMLLVDLCRRKVGLVLVGDMGGPRLSAAVAADAWAATCSCRWALMLWWPWLELALDAFEVVRTGKR